MANRDKRLNLDQTLANLSDERVGLLRLEWIARQGLAERYFPPLWTSLLSRGPSHQSLAAKPTQLTLQTQLLANHSLKPFPNLRRCVPSREYNSGDDKVLIR